MNTLIEELKNDHAEIVKVLTKVKELGISSKGGQEMHLAAKEGLLAHLKKEDERLYPALRRSAENNPGLKQTLDMFTKDMASISKAAIDFFGKYTGGGSGIEFAKDFGGLVGVLGGRIQKEEKIIYAEYEKLMR